MKLISRGKWGARSVGLLSTNISPEFGGTAIHYVGGSGKLVSMPHSKCAGVVREIQKQHIQTNGWSDIAYSFLVCPHGYVLEGRGIGKRTAANGTTSGNLYYYAVCGLINNGETPTPQMVEAIAEACQYLRTKGKAGDKIVGHRNIISTSCPGPLYEYVRKGTFQRKKVKEDRSYPGTLFGVNYKNTGSNVKLIQSRLKALGYNVAPDGRFGPITEKAIKAFQKANKLASDGLVGKNTWNKLF